MLAIQQLMFANQQFKLPI